MLLFKIKAKELFSPHQKEKKSGIKMHFSLYIYLIFCLLAKNVVNVTALDGISA